MVESCTVSAPSPSDVNFSSDSLHSEHLQESIEMLVAGTGAETALQQWGSTPQLLAMCTSIHIAKRKRSLLQPQSSVHMADYTFWRCQPDQLDLFGSNIYLLPCFMEE